MSIVHEHFEHSHRGMDNLLLAIVRTSLGVSRIDDLQDDVCTLGLGVTCSSAGPWFRSVAMQGTHWLASSSRGSQAAIPSSSGICATVLSVFTHHQSTWEAIRRGIRIGRYDDLHH